MGRLLPRTTKARLHVGAGIALSVAVLAGFFTFAGPAFAHHPSIEGWSDCDEHGHVVEFTSESWSDSMSAGGGNTHIDIAYRLKPPDGAPGAWTVLPWDASYLYNQANDFQFDGTFPITEAHPDGTEVQLRAEAGAPWSNGTVNDEPRDSDWIELPTDCDCNKPTTTTTKHDYTTTTEAPTTSTTKHHHTTTTTAPTTTTEAPTTTTEAPTTSTTKHHHTTTTTAPTTTTEAPTTTTTTTAPTTTTTGPTTTGPTTTTTGPTTTTTTVVVTPNTALPTTTVLPTTTTVVPTTTTAAPTTTTTTGPTQFNAQPAAAVLGVSETQAAVLPATGSNTFGLVAIGGALLLAGVFLVRAARIRDED